VALILITSMLGVIFGGYNQPADEFEYNGYQFERVQNKWLFEANGRTIQVDSYPSSVESINISPQIMSSIKSTRMLFVSVPTQGTNLDYIGLASYELSEFLRQEGLYAVAGISDDNTGYNLPLIDCTNATAPIPVVILQQSNQTSVTEQNNCITISARSGIDFIRIKDKIIFEFLGIM